MGGPRSTADCARLRLSPTLRQFCPPNLPGNLGIDGYHHLAANPNFHPVIPPGATEQELMTRFGLVVLREQPLDFVSGVLRDFAKGFAWTKTTSPGDVPVRRWQFQTRYPVYNKRTDAEVAHYNGMRPTVIEPLARFLRGYQRHGGYTPGTLLGVSALLGLFGGIRPRRTRDSRGTAWGARAGGVLLAGCGITILLTSAFFEFSWRYQLPALVLFPLAGGLGLASMIGASREPAQVRTGRRVSLASYPDPVDELALAEFRLRYGRPEFAPVTVIIAAYNEASGIGAVLANLPKRCCEQELDVLVVADGCVDATADVALAHGAYTLIAPSNRGQGAALRLGYQVAARHGADYVVTTDADGQYDNDEMPLLLEPLLRGEADFVTGSRRLGHEARGDRLRWAGVRFFAALASVLTMRQITDTSFGCRAMSAGLASSVRLRQPQYQASELLLGALAGGARYREVPMTMRARSAGQTKKGGNLVYGFSYGKVMTGTWVREYLWHRLLRRP